jgi:hypothetical protein
MGLANAIRALLSLMHISQMVDDATGSPRGSITNGQERTKP